MSMPLTLVHGHFSMVWTSVHGYGQFSMLWTVLHEWKAIKCPLTVCEFVLRRRVALFLAKSVYEIWICRLRFLTILTTFSDTVKHRPTEIIFMVNWQNWKVVFLKFFISNVIPKTNTKVQHGCLLGVAVEILKKRCKNEKNV